MTTDPKNKSMKALIADSSIGAGLRDIKERGIDAHLASEYPDRPKLRNAHGGWTKCRSCKADIVFAIMYTSGKPAPFEKDDAGEWQIENGIAKHAGPVATQADMFAGPGPQRWTSHFARCKDAPKWRR